MYVWGPHWEDLLDREVPHHVKFLLLQEYRVAAHQPYITAKQQLSPTSSSKCRSNCTQRQVETDTVNFPCSRRFITSTWILMQVYHQIWNWHQVAPKPKTIQESKALPQPQTWMHRLHWHWCWQQWQCRHCWCACTEKSSHLFGAQDMCPGPLSALYACGMHPPYCLCEMKHTFSTLFKQGFANNRFPLLWNRLQTPVLSNSHLRR